MKKIGSSVRYLRETKQYKTDFSRKATKNN